MKEYNDQVKKNNQAREFPLMETPGGVVDVFSKIEEQRPNFLPPIAQGSQSPTQSNLKKKKMTPKIFDLSEQLKALEEEKSKLQRQKMSILSSKMDD